ncbi:MAG: radical SAM protein [bacterium]
MVDQIEFIKNIFLALPFGTDVFNYLYLKYLYFLKRNQKTIVSYPFQIFQIELTNHCPMKCIMCPRTYKMDRKLGFMSFELYKKAIDEYIEVNPKAAKRNRIWLHHFGESLLHPNFEKFIEYANSKGMKPCISINPFLLTQKNIEKLLVSKPYLLYISLDGHDDESFYQIRGKKNAFEISKNNLLSFLDQKIKRKSAIIVHLSMINFKENQESIHTMKKYWKTIRGIDKVFIKPFETFAGDVESINKYAKQNKNLSQESICRFPWTSMSLAWDGTIVACCRDYNNILPLGNLNNQSLTEIWNGKAMQFLRKTFINNKNILLCKKCELLHNPPKL